MRLLISAIFAATVFGLLTTGSASAQLEQLTNGINQANNVVNQVGGIVNDINSITGGGGGGGGSTTTSAPAPGAGMFNPDTVFPAWGEGGQVTGVIGSNVGALNQGEGRLLIYFIPKIVELMIWLVAPIITIMFLYSGIIFVYAGDREEEVKKARDFFRFAVIGLVFIVLSYSIMKAVFFIIV
ncbi:hypothetical protein GW756_05405 [bacterium]|nr:hypothetical protein [bacterium]NCQ55336.1 hypothetical protein [Candidatus Parcubacteria bacterium]NCS67151.1 hypothetical protein [Candidatus Peregrinibacteria bacterium]NCS96777.1 hypothetical protein [bacterium]